MTNKVFNYHGPLKFTAVVIALDTYTASEVFNEFVFKRYCKIIESEPKDFYEHVMNHNHVVQATIVAGE